MVACNNIAIGSNKMRRILLCAFAICLIFLSAASRAHVGTINYVANISDDSIAAVEAYLESTTGMNATVILHGGLDWAVSGTGVGLSRSGNFDVYVFDPADLDADGFPHYGIWEYSQPFPPVINYQVVSFDAGSPIGVQYALYAHNEPGTDIFSSGFFRTDDFADGSGPHGWTDFSFYNVVLTPWSDGDLAPRGAPDGIADTADVLICQRIVLGLISPTVAEISHGDIRPDGALDGAITMSDCISIQQAALLP